MFGISSEKLQNLFHTKLAGATLAAFNCLICEFSLLLLEIENSLLNRILDSDFIDNHVHFLSQSMNSVDCLFFHKLLHN